MPIAISTTPHDVLVATRHLNDNLRGTGAAGLRDSNHGLRDSNHGLRDSKGLGVRLGVRASGVRSLGGSLGFGGETSKASAAFLPDASPRPTTSRTASSRSDSARNSTPMSFFARMPQEPEDARLTGITRSLARRLLALNLPGSLRARPVMRVETAWLADRFA